MGSAKDVADHHLKSFGERDPKGILSDYCTGYRPVHAARTAQRARCDQVVVRGDAGGVQKTQSRFGLKQQFVEGDYAYILQETETADNVYELGSDTFRAEEQDCSSVIRRQGHVQALKTRFDSRRLPNRPMNPTDAFGARSLSAPLFSLSIINREITQKAYLQPLQVGSATLLPVDSFLVISFLDFSRSIKHFKLKYMSSKIVMKSTYPLLSLFQIAI